MVRLKWVEWPFVIINWNWVYMVSRGKKAYTQHMLLMAPAWIYFGNSYKNKDKKMVKTISTYQVHFTLLPLILDWHFYMYQLKLDISFQKQNLWTEKNQKYYNETKKCLRSKRKSHAWATFGSSFSENTTVLWLWQR